MKKAKHSHPKDKHKETSQVSREVHDIFVEEYKEKVASNPKSLTFETEKHYCKRKEAEFTADVDNAADKILKMITNGIEAFQLKNGDYPSVIKLLMETSPEQLGQNSDMSTYNTPQTILGISNDDYLELYEWAAGELEHKHYQKASDMFCILNIINPFFYPVIVDWGLAQSFLGNRESADSLYGIAVTINPEEPLAYLYGAENCYLMGKDHDADTLIERAIALGHSLNDPKFMRMAHEIQHKIAA